MGWANKMKEYGPANVLFLSTDGASVNFIVVDDPVLLKGTYRKKEQERIGAPVVTPDGFVLLVVGKRVARKLSTLEEKFSTSVLNLTRHGQENDQDTTYEVTVLEDGELFARLQSLKAKTFTKAALKEAVKDAEAIMSS